MNTREIATKARQASELLALAETQQKNEALLRMAGSLAARKAEIVDTNRADMDEAAARGVSGTMLARLAFDESRVDGRIASLKKIAVASSTTLHISSNLRPRPLNARWSITPA